MGFRQEAKGKRQKVRKIDVSSHAKLITQIKN
jgi:hypothetical protein